MIGRRSPVGVFDSGIGGLTILKRISSLLPHEELIYYADTASCPYGGRSSREITELSRRALSRLESLGVKAIVIACNTASVQASAALREEFAMPIIATEPAVKPAIEGTKSGVIGVLATQSTVDSGQIVRLAKIYGDGVELVIRAGNGLVEMVEREEIDGEGVREVLAAYIEPMLAAGSDHIVLGCTHYPFLKGTIEKILAERGKGDVRVIDTAYPVARRLEWMLGERGLLNDSPDKGRITFIGSMDDGDRLEKIFGKLVVSGLPD